MTWTSKFATLGLCLSAYAVYAEFQHAQNPDFEALCDISAEISCSKVFASEQGKVWSHLGLIEKDSFLDQPNAVYDSQASNKTAARLLLLMGVMGVALSCYLGYVLFFVLQDTCVLCIGSYVCNFVVFCGGCSAYLDTIYGGVKAGGNSMSHGGLDDIYKKAKSS